MDTAFRCRDLSRALCVRGMLAVKGAPSLTCWILLQLQVVRCLLHDSTPAVAPPPFLSEAWRPSVLLVSLCRLAGVELCGGGEGREATVGACSSVPPPLGNNGPSVKHGQRGWYGVLISSSTVKRCNLTDLLLHVIIHDWPVDNSLQFYRCVSLCFVFKASLPLTSRGGMHGTARCMLLHGSWCHMAHGVVKDKMSHGTWWHYHDIWQHMLPWHTMA